MVSFACTRTIRKQSNLAIATLVVVWLFVILVLKPGFMQRVVQAQTPGSQRLLVRGYIAARPGQQREGGIVLLASGKDVYLPGVEVFLGEPQGGVASRPGKTDLSGRFTVFAAKEGRYHICWKSPVYGAGCDSRFVSAGGAPQFVSTVRIPLPVLAGHVAIAGHVVTADNSVPRTFDPLLNINSFAMVTLRDEKGVQMTEVYVNNFGDYLLPYVPVKQKVNVTASVESAKVSQEILPAARIEAAPLSQVNLKFENHRPRLDPLVAFDSSNKRVQNAAPGSKVHLQAKARDRDGDPLKYAWFVGEGQGKLVQSNGPQMEWEVPSVKGRYTAVVVAYDEKGGYDKAQLSVLVGNSGIPFTGIVVNPAGAPVEKAEVEIVGNPSVKTDGRGYFQTTVKEDDRYVLNIRKEGYALNSQIYDRSVTGGRWIIRPAQVITIDPTRDVRIVNRRLEQDCPGPGSMRAGLGVAGASLTIPEWQDGSGNATDPPAWWSGPRKVRDLKAAVPVARGGRGGEHGEHEHGTVILPRQLKLPPCGPGVGVEIAANSIVDENGNPVTSPFKATITTVDLLSAEQMPGDDSVVPTGGGGAFLQSFGAGALDLPSGHKLKPGATATFTIPVDRRARMAGGSLPPSVPLLSYNEKRGLWVEEGTMTLTTQGGVSAYTAKVKHFTTYNADTFFGSGAACVRVFSPSLPGQYNLEVMSPYPDGTPHYKNYPIDNVTATEHVIYNITPNANITLAPMTQGATPQLLGFYIVNSGRAQNPSTSPAAPPGPPYISCQNFVVLTVGGAPESPFGGEFLHGLGYLAAENLGFDDLTTAAPSGNALKDAIVQASRNYYQSADPTTLRDTFAKFKSQNGLSADPTTPAAGETVGQYANSGDLGFGRDMHCLKKTNGDVACYVTNYGTGYNNSFPGDGTPDTDDAKAAATRTQVGQSKEVATVAMEYAPIENDPVGDRVVKFFVYKKDFPNAGDYGRSISANLDGRGERPVPQLCMICHGGLVPNESGNPPVPVFSTAAQVKLGARFLPFDYRFYTFDPGASKTAQDPNFKSLNEQIVNAAPPTGAGDPINEIVSGLYNNGASATQIHDFVVPGWANGASANAPNQANFYTGVIANPCRTCHTAQPFSQLQFNTSDKFVNVGGVSNKLMLGTAQLRVCGDYTMPHALRTHDIFWNVYTWNVTDWGPPPTPFYTQFQNFGDGVGGPTWKPGLCTSFIASTVQSPSFFYEQSIQPIWNGKCVSCHITGGIAPFSLTEGVSYSQLVPGRVVPGNDSNTAGALLQRITGAGPGAKMPLGCIPPPTPPGPGQLPCLDQPDIDKIKAWIRSGAN
jgi:hypothetical protein